VPHPGFWWLGQGQRMNVHVSPSVSGEDDEIVAVDDLPLVLRS
jgi:hypothetical protein